MYSILALGLAVLPAALAASYDVSVGANGNLEYDPPYVTAQVGDIVNFVFHQKNHTVTQSNFATPCSPNGGLNSGFMPVAADATTFPNWQVTVQDTKPMWFYCAQTGHCPAGMVFAINPGAAGSANSFAAFQNLAEAGAASTSTAPSSYSTPPPQSWAVATATVTCSGSTWASTYTSYYGTPPPTFAPQPVNHLITVGANGQLAFNPPNITAALGDTVTFEFHQKNHTATQSSFNNPCVPLAATSTTGQIGFNTGFQPVAANVTADFPTVTFRINNTSPIWGFCQQTGHCGQGMVFSINAVESGQNNFENFQSLAKHINGTLTSLSGNGTASPSPSAKPSSGALSTTSGLTFGVFAIVVPFFFL